MRTGFLSIASPRFGRLASLASLASTVAACAGGSTAPPPPEPPRTALPESPAAGAPGTAVTPAANGSGAADAGAAPALDLTADVKAANAFTSNLYVRAKKAPGNLMLSGTSVRHALEIVYLGARNGTARELATALELPADPANVGALAKAVDAAWQEARGKAELFVANRLWADQTFPLKSDFTTAADAAFGAAAQAVDFQHAPDVARRAINAWVSEKTALKIPDLLAEGSVDKRARVVVTNAIYFKGKWAVPFQTAATRDEPFKGAAKGPGTEGAHTTNVPMMHATSSHRFAHVGHEKVLELRYDGSQLGMLVVLPDDAAALAKFEDTLSADLFDSWTKALALQRVAVTLPKFGFTWGSALSAPLQELGVKTAFSQKADLSGIADTAGAERLQLSQVMHKTWVAVDEQGTEAAASTGAVMSTTSLPLGPVADFKADHPFLFFVYDTKKGRILFAGRVSDPKS